MIGKILREPIVQFLVIGGLIYVAYGMVVVESEDTSGRKITITAAEIGWMEKSWTKRWNRSPTPAERKGLIDNYIRETVLYREALAMGLDKDDTIIRRRLAQKLEFLSEDLAMPLPPSDEMLKRYFDTHEHRYRSPVLTTFTHVYFDRDRRGANALVDARKARVRLASLAPSAKQVDKFGDRFMLQRYYPGKSEAELSKLFGREFAQQVSRLEPGNWQGPVLSGYGFHLVYVHSRTAPKPPDFAAVRAQVRWDWTDEKRAELNKIFIAGLLARYHIVIEDAAPGAAKAKTE